MIHFKERLLGLIVFIIYRLYSSTIRYRFRSLSDQIKIRRTFWGRHRVDHGGNVIYAFWHQHEIPLLAAFAGEKNVNMMISSSRDGSILDTVVKLYGFKTMRGSSSRGGRAAYDRCLDALGKGDSVVLAVDGPKGPIFKAKPGATRLSSETQCDIVPVLAFPKKYHQLKKSWSKEMVPLPFSVVDVVIMPKGKYSIEELEEKLSFSLS